MSTRGATIENVICPTMPAGSGRVCGVVTHPTTKDVHCMHCAANVSGATAAAPVRGHQAIRNGEL